MAEAITDWFGSDYYHLLYSDRNEAEAKIFLDNLIQLVQPANDSKIIDCGCGRGRHSVYLAEKGFDVTGIDISAANISFAKKNEMKNLSFAVHDLRKPFPCEPYDIALNMFTSFGYYEIQEENSRVFKNISSLLRKGGLLVFDFMNSKKEIKNLVPREKIIRDGISFLVMRSIKGNFIMKEIHVEHQKKQFYFTERVHALSETELQKYFTANGMKIIHKFGNYELEPFADDASPRLIFTAKKP